jgi:hypothetical protein
MPHHPLSIAPLLAALILTPIEAAAETAAPAAGIEAVPATEPPAAGEPAPAPPSAPDSLTLKERLGAKWKDDQRVNNCKVPPEKRGTKPRPDGCVKDHTD